MRRLSPSGALLALWLHNQPIYHRIVCKKWSDQALSFTVENMTKKTLPTRAQCLNRNIYLIYITTLTLKNIHIKNHQCPFRMTNNQLPHHGNPYSPTRNFSCATTLGDSPIYDSDRRLLPLGNISEPWPKRCVIMYYFPEHGQKRPCKIWGLATENRCKWRFSQQGQGHHERKSYNLARVNLICPQVLNSG